MHSNPSVRGHLIDDPDGKVQYVFDLRNIPGHVFRGHGRGVLRRISGLIALPAEPVKRAQDLPIGGSSWADTASNTAMWPPRLVGRSP
jgi:hypothetical protein